MTALCRAVVGPSLAPLCALNPNKYYNIISENRLKKPSGYDEVLGWFRKPKAMVIMVNWLWLCVARTIRDPHHSHLAMGP